MSLQLDFSLESDEARTDFITHYLKTMSPESQTPENLELMASYILWGRNKDGFNTDQLHLTQNPTKHTTWDPQNRVESLDALVESPLFEESLVRPLDAIPYKTPRTVFDRAKALKIAPDSLKSQLRALFHQIDLTEFTLNQWELMNGRRTKPPRESLTKNLTLTEQQAAQSTATSWSHYWYLKAKHRLVELRRSQYALGDAFALPRLRPSVNHTFGFQKTDSPLLVLPLGTPTQCPYIWRPLNSLTPDWGAALPPETQHLVSDFWWAQYNKQQHLSDQETWIDLRDLSQLTAAFALIDEFAQLDDFEDPVLKDLGDALMFYLRETPLTPTQALIANLKVRHFHHLDIAAAVNKQFGTAYTTNYISTIWNTKVLVKVQETIQIHSQLITNIWFEKEFKKCSRCGRIKLKHERYFGKQSRSPDGWATRCKCCEKEMRENKRMKTVENKERN